LSSAAAKSKGSDFAEGDLSQKRPAHLI